MSNRRRFNLGSARIKKSRFDVEGVLLSRAVFDGDCRPNATPRRESGDDLHPTRGRDFHKIIENAVRHVFIERTDVPVRLEIHLQRLQFEASLVGDVADRQCAEIRLTGFGAQGRELRADRFHHIIAVRERVLESFQEIGRHGRRHNRLTNKQNR